MSGWWSQCPWGKSSAPTERIGSFLTPTGGFGYCRRVFGRSRAPPLRRGVDTVRHLSGFGGGRYSLAGHIGPALRMGVVAVYHTPRLGGGRYRGGADRGVRPYGGVSCPYTMQPFVVVIVTMVGRSRAPPLRRGVDAVRHSCGGGGWLLPDTARRGRRALRGNRCRLPFGRRRGSIAAGLAGHIGPALRGMRVLRRAAPVCAVSARQRILQTVAVVDGRPPVSS